MYRPADSSFSERYLDRDERHAIARLKEAGHSNAAIAKALRRHPSTIGRELTRNSAGPRAGAADRTGDRTDAGVRYEPERADTLAWQRQRRPKATVWQQRPPLREAVQAMLDKRYSPEQVSGRLRLDYPVTDPARHPTTDTNSHTEAGADAGADPEAGADNQLMQVSHETIYRALYVHPHGELTRTLKAHLRSGRTTRRRQGRQERRGTIPNMVSIHDRPEEVAGRLVPGHHEGDLIKGSLASNSAIGTIVERHSGYLTLIHLPHGWAAEHVAAAITTQMNQYPAWFAKTLTWDRGTEMTQHHKITADTGIQIYFADPYSPQQRPSNENTNGLLRQYFPKSTDLSVHDAAHLHHIATELNNRPRKRLGYRTPAEILANLQTQASIATTA
jgi:IS30 family transposase